MLQKKPIKIWNVNADDIVGYLDKDIRPLVLIMFKMTGYVNTFKVEDENNK